MTDQGATEANPFSSDVIEAVCSHMRGDHGKDTLVMCQGVGGHPKATEAEMISLDGIGGDYRISVPEGEKTIRIPWARPLTERAEIRPEVVRIYQESCRTLGLPVPE